MKHVFIINPIAGIVSQKDFIISELNEFKNDYDIEYHVTTHEKEAIGFIKKYLENYAGEVRFYACGGDGTLNETVNATFGRENASVSVYPCGSGNDFVKSIGGAEKYLNIKSLLNAENQKIDLLCVNGVYCVNVCNVGFDANVCKIANDVKGKSDNPYKTGLIRAVFKGALRNKVTVVADNEVLNENGKLLLCSIANGQYIGGKYKCAPYAEIDDGLIDVCLIKTMSLFKFISLVPSYERGEHIGHKRTVGKVLHRTAKTVTLSAAKDFPVCIDGEIAYGKNFKIEILKNALSFGIVK